MEEISWMSKSGYSDIELLEYIDKHFDEIECELNGEVYKEPKKRDHNFCMDCKLRKIVDYERSTLVCTKCGLCEYLSSVCSVIQSCNNNNATFEKEMHIQEI